MTEKEKAAAGLWYNANNDSTLIHERLCAKDLCSDFNMLRHHDEEEKNEILSRLFSYKGFDCLIMAPLYCELGYNISIGDNFYANHNLVIIDSARVTIGNNVFIGPNVGIYCTEYPIDYTQRNLGLERARSITIGNNVWIGGGTQIYPGANIGDGTVIGIGSVVMSDIPKNVIAAGNPCHILHDTKQSSPIQPD